MDASSSRSESESKPVKPWRIWLKTYGWYIAGSVALALAVYLLWFWPQRMVPGGEALKPLERFTMVNEKRRTAVQMIGGSFFILTAFFSWRTVKAAERNADAANRNAEAANENVRVANINASLAAENLRVAQEKLEQDRRLTEQTLKVAAENLSVTQAKQSAERFIKATENLDSDKLSTRIGAVYSLERVANESTKDRKTVVEVLSAFLKNSASRDNYKYSINDIKDRVKTPLDVEAALKLMGSRPADGSTRIQLRSCYFHDATLFDIDWDIKITYRNISFSYCILSEVTAIGCDFVNCSFYIADARSASFSSSKFHHVDFEKANLEDADFEHSVFVDTDFAEAKLTRALFCGANLTRVKNLTQKQVDSAIMSRTTQLPDDLCLPETLTEDEGK